MKPHMGFKVFNSHESRDVYMLPRGWSDMQNGSLLLHSEQETAVACSCEKTIEVYELDVYNSNTTIV